MKTFRKAFFTALMSVGFVLSSNAWAEHTRVTNPNMLGIEVFGRGLLWGFVFDRVLNDDMSAGIGFGSTGTKTLADADTGKSATMIPVFVNYYFTRDQGSVFATAGATLVSNSSDVRGFKSSVGNVEFSSSAVQATFGAGYENRSDNGFLFRVTGYGIAANKIAPWFGFTFGYAF